MIKTLKKHKSIILLLVLFVCVSSMFSSIVTIVSAKYNGFKIVIDAGHGGRDGGSIGANGTIEKEINLDYSIALKDKLISSGFVVEMTRKNDDGLYSLLDKNKKLADMKERMRIIKNTNPNLVISIHMNSFKMESAKGAITYYRKGDAAGMRCANLIQKSFYEFCGAKFQDAKVGDYYILNSSYYTAVLIECGFLSNIDEEFLLNTDDYKNKIIDSIYKGVLLYLGNK